MKMIPLKERIFETIDGSLFVFEKGIEEAGLSVNYYRKEKSNNNKRLIFIDHPMDRRFNLVAFETLSEAHREKVIARYKNPYEFVTREPILRMVQRNLEQYNNFLQYEYSDKKLPIKKVMQYSRAADWLEMLKSVSDAKNQPIKDLGITLPNFYDHVKYLVQLEKETGKKCDNNDVQQLPSDFPSSYVKLTQKLLKYKKDGWKMLIDPMYGNQHAAKVNDDVAEAQLLTLLEDPRQFSDELIAMFYNQWAKDNNYKLITSATVGVWRRSKEYLIIMGREGNSAYNEKYIRQVKGLRPSFPLALVEHDDNNLDFLFHNTEDKYVSKYVSIVVMDSHNDLVLGKSYIVGTSPKIEQVKQAYIDAMYYVRKLTGGWHLPFEIKNDKYASAALKPFYQSIAKSIPAGHGNKHRGYIEQLFGSPHWKRAQQLVTDPTQMNWSANNMSARTRGVNQETLDQNQRTRNLPLIGSQAELQIENFFLLLQKMPAFTRENMNAKSKEEQWLEKWNELSIEQKRPITDEQFLLTFGITHQPRHTDFIRITNRGVEPQINKAQYSYDLPEAWMYQKLRGAQVQLVYDPYDMSRILVTNFDDIRFIAHTAQLQPRAIEDTYTGCRTYLNAILNEKKDQVNEVATASEKRKQIADKKFYNAEALMQSGMMIKEIKNEAEQKMIDNNFNQELESFLDEKNDYDEFFTTQNKIA
jgi:hypothetical protein